MYENENGYPVTMTLNQRKDSIMACICPKQQNNNEY